VSTVTLYCGDALETLRSLPDDSVDIVVTSPPYNQLGRRIPRVTTGKHKNDGFFRKISRIGYSDDMPEQDYQGWISGIVRECLRVSKGLVWINHKIRYRDGSGIHPARFLNYPIYSEVIWARSGSLALNCRRFAPSHEMILGFGRPHYWDAKSNRMMSVWKINQVQNRTDHPCPFPKEIPRRLIQASCPPGGVTLDPFCGSGTTGEACMELGHNFIGIEIDPEYFAIARDRIDAAQASTATA